MKPKKEYILWVNYGTEGWGWQDFDTLKEALESEKFGHDWTITKRVDYEIKEV